MRWALEEKLVQDRTGCRSESDRGARVFRRFPQGAYRDRLDYRGRCSPGRSDRESLDYLGHHSLDLAEWENWSFHYRRSLDRESLGFQDPHLQNRVADRECLGYQDRHSLEPAGRENWGCRPLAYAC